MRTQHALVAVLAVALAWAPSMLSDFMLSLVLTCLMYAGLTVTWAMFSGATNYLSLATAAFFGIGAYAAVLLSPKTDAASLFWLLPACVLAAVPSTTRLAMP